MEVGRDDPALHPLGHDDLLLLRRKAWHLEPKLVHPRIELHGLTVEVVDEQRAVEVHAGRRRLLAVHFGIDDD